MKVCFFRDPTAASVHVVGGTIQNPDADPQTSRSVQPSFEGGQEISVSFYFLVVFFSPHFKAVETQFKDQETRGVTGGDSSVLLTVHWHTVPRQSDLGFSETISDVVHRRITFQEVT